MAWVQNKRWSSIFLKGMRAGVQLNQLILSICLDEERYSPGLNASVSLINSPDRSVFQLL